MIPSVGRVQYLDDDWPESDQDCEDDWEILDRLPMTRSYAVVTRP
jgi:hypothetical protein